MEQRKSGNRSLTLDDGWDSPGGDGVQSLPQRAHQAVVLSARRFQASCVTTPVAASWADLRT